MHPERLLRAIVKIFTRARQRVLPQAPNEDVTFTVLIRLNAKRKNALLWQGLFNCILLSFCFFDLVWSLFTIVLDGLLFKIWKELGGNLGSVLLSLVQPEHLTAIQWLCVVVVWSYVLILAGAIWLIFQAKRAFSELRLLYALSRMDPSQIRDFSIGKYLSLSYPFLFRSDLDDNPSPEVLLGVIQEKKGLEDSLVAAVLSALSGEGSAVRKFLISLGHHVTFSPISALVAPEPLILTRAQAWLVSFFALQEKGAWILKKEVESALSRPNKKTNIDQLRQRLNDTISNYVRQNCASLIDDEDKQSYKIEVIEFKTQGNRSSWRLSPVCDIATFAEISRFYQSIHRTHMQQDNTSVLSIEDLRVVYEQLKGVYKGGFLSEYFDKKNPMPPWARKQYCNYRDQWMEILFYMIGREQELIEDPKSSKEEQNEGAYSQAIMYGQKALAAVTAVPQSPYGEADLKRCLLLYKGVKRLREAREVLSEYAHLRRDFDGEWKVSDELINICPEYFKRIVYESNRI